MQTKYGEIKESLERQISLGVGFVKIIGKLSDWGGDRRIMQESQESRQGANKNLPTILE